MSFNFKHPSRYKKTNIKTKRNHTHDHHDTREDHPKCFSVDPQSSAVTAMQQHDPNASSLCDGENDTQEQKIKRQ